MAKNFRAESRYVTIPVAPYAQDAGGGMLVGSMWGVVQTDVKISEQTVIDTQGVYDLDMTVGEVWAVGSPIYWVVGTKLVSSNAGGGANQQIGIALAVTTAQSTYGRVRLNGPPGILSAIAEAAAVADLTEGGGAIGGAQNGDLASQTATAATIAGALTGATDGTLANVADIAIASAGGNTYADVTVNTAINAVILDANLQIKELQVMVNKVIADNVAQRDAIRELAAHINTILARLRTTNVIA